MWYNTDMKKPTNTEELVNTLRYLACQNCGHAVNIPEELLEQVSYLENYEKISVKKDLEGRRTIIKPREEVWT